MARKLRGNVWVFQGILDVDWAICPMQVLRDIRDRGGAWTYEELGKHAMSGVDPDFAKKVKKGDFIVAGESMGYGHDHDHASQSLKGAGVGAVICESTNANFLRNSIDHGLPVIECRGINRIAKQGDELEIDLVAGKVRNLGSGAELRFSPYPEFLMERLVAGGLYPYLEQQLKAGKL